MDSEALNGIDTVFQYPSLIQMKSDDSAHWVPNAINNSSH